MKDELEKTDGPQSKDRSQLEVDYNWEKDSLVTTVMGNI